MKILVAGGAGYIGSSIASALLDAGHHPVILDNLSTGCASFVRGRPFYRADIEDLDALRAVFTDHPDITLAIHCAGMVRVEESVSCSL